MNVQEQIEKEFNKDKNSYIDLYLILDLLLSQNNQKINNEDLEKNSFNNNEVIKAIASLSNINPDKFKIDNTVFGSKSDPTLSLVVIINNGLDKETFFLIRNNSPSGESNFMLEHNKNNIQRRLYLMKELESSFKIPLKHSLKTPYEKQYYFQFNITSNLNENFTKSEYIKSPDKDEHLNTIFSTIGNSINNKQPASETFDLLNMQYDFFSEEFKKSIIYFFEEENSTTKHDNILLNIKKNNENKNKIKLKY